MEMYPIKNVQMHLYIFNIHLNLMEQIKKMGSFVLYGSQKKKYLKMRENKRNYIKISTLLLKVSVATKQQTVENATYCFRSKGVGYLSQHVKL